MSVADARALLEDVQAKNGLPPARPVEVTSVDELLGILNGDEMERFGDAARFVEGKPGIDALTLDAIVELAWSDGLSTVASIGDDLSKRAAVEVERLGEKQKSGRDFTAADAKMLEDARNDVSELTKIRAALQVLSADHLSAGDGRVKEALRQFPDDRRTHRVGAYAHLLRADWAEYDLSMSWFEGEKASTDAGIQYLRAMEALKRFGTRDEARGFLENALRLNPKLVRAQATLVLAQDDIGAKYAELQKLRKMAPRHPVCIIAGPTIDREYAFSTSLSGAREAEQRAPSGDELPAKQ